MDSVLHTEERISTASPCPIRGTELSSDVHVAEQCPACAYYTQLCQMREQLQG